MYFVFLFFLQFLLFFDFDLQLVNGKNPIVSNVGMADPHIHVFGNQFYLYSTHDFSARDTSFVMNNWWSWSSPDLVHWSMESMVWPNQTAAPLATYHECWATDAAAGPDGQFFFYLSFGPNQVGVVSGPTPNGPWSSPLDKPMLTAQLGKELGTVIRDPAVFCSSDDPSSCCYIVFGVFDYYIARLDRSMVRLAEKPRKIKVLNAIGPYGPNKTDDKPFLHYRNGVYYLSWGCFYGVSTSPYGPFDGRGSVIERAYLAPSFRLPDNDSLPWYAQPNLYDRHGSFFHLHNQWFFVTNDRSHSSDARDSDFFRDSVIGYVHYFGNGSIAPVVINSIGVGEYFTNVPIEAENYMMSDPATEQVHVSNANFAVRIGSLFEQLLVFPNVHRSVSPVSILRLHFTSCSLSSVQVRVECNFCRQVKNEATLTPDQLVVEVPITVPFINEKFDLNLSIIVINDNAVCDLDFFSF